MWRPAGAVGTTLGQGIAGVLRERANQRMGRANARYRRGIHPTPWLRALLAVQSTKS